jgi:hypothetical protein
MYNHLIHFQRWLVEEAAVPVRSAVVGGRLAVPAAELAVVGGRGPARDVLERAVLAMDDASSSSRFRSSWSLIMRRLPWVSGAILTPAPAAPGMPAAVAGFLAVAPAPFRGASTHDGGRAPTVKPSGNFLPRSLRPPESTKTLSMPRCTNVVADCVAIFSSSS